MMIISMFVRQRDEKEADKIGKRNEIIVKIIILELLFFLPRNHE